MPKHKKKSKINPNVQEPEDKDTNCLVNIKISTQPDDVWKIFNIKHHFYLIV